MCDCILVVEQKAADEVRISDWSSDVCSSDLSSSANVDGTPGKPVTRSRASASAPRCGNTRLSSSTTRAPTAKRVCSTRSVERRVGKEWARTVRFRWSALHDNKKHIHMCRCGKSLEREPYIK